MGWRSKRLPPICRRYCPILILGCLTSRTTPLFVLGCCPDFWRPKLAINVSRKNKLFFLAWSWQVELKWGGQRGGLAGAVLEISGIWKSRFSGRVVASRIMRFFLAITRVFRLVWPYRDDLPNLARSVWCMQKQRQRNARLIRPWWKFTKITKETKNTRKSTKIAKVHKRYWWTFFVLRLGFHRFFPVFPNWSYPSSPLSNMCRYSVCTPYLTIFFFPWPNGRQQNCTFCHSQ